MKKITKGGGIEYVPKHGEAGQKEARKLLKQLKTDIGKLDSPDKIKTADVKILVFIIAKELDII